MPPSVTDSVLTPVPAPASPAAPSRLRVLLAFAAVYLLWGSTYLAIRWAVEDVPPLLMAGIRNLSAGAALFAWERARGAPAPRASHWRWALAIGALLFVGGNGAVSWSELRVPSGLVALLVGAVPLWMAVLQAAAGAGRPPASAWAGIGLGLAGIGVLVGPTSFAGGRGVDPVATLVLMGGALAWSWGSLLARRAAQPSSPLLASALQMLSGGALLVVVGLAAGEGARLDPARVSARSALALVYLVTFGSIVAFSAYLWLMRVVAPSRVATYAFVNPVIAVLLGWAFAGEPLTARTLLAALMIVGAVALITLGPRRGARARTRD